MKLMLVRLLATIALAVCAGRQTFAWQEDAKPSTTQEQAPPDSASPEPAPKPKPQFFAGTLTQVLSDRIVVSRKLLGKAPESKTFLLQASTKTNRPLKAKQRVTVRYEHQDETDVALEVLVKQTHTAKPN